MSDALLELKSIKKRFGGLMAVSDLSFRVEVGSITSLIGPNGSGKTTSFNIITKLITPDAGRILFCGENIEGLPAHEIPGKGIARTFQIISLFEKASVLENVACGAYSNTTSGAFSIICRLSRARREEKDIVERAMNAIKANGLEKWANAPAGSLPFGQQRLVELSRALVGNPKLLLMDEPLSGLTQKEGEILEDKIREIRGSGITVFFVEHKMKAVMKISEKIIVLNFGQKLAEGSPDEIRSNEAVINVYLGRGE
jgi:branched-chain amino acid transport system ATP-binding protein